MKLKDPAWRAKESSVFNVDSYVFFALESFYGQDGKQWEDPVAPRWFYRAEVKDEPAEAVVPTSSRSTPPSATILNG